MNYGLYLSATGVRSNLHRQDVLTNNLTNVETIGFKPAVVETRQRLPERLESSDTFSDPKWMLETLGGGHLVNPTRVSLEQGALKNTNQPLDVAVEGDGFFAVRSVNGDQHLTRDGRFTIDEDGYLAHAATGELVLDAQFGPVRMNGATELEIHGDGTLFRDGKRFGQLALVDAPAASLVARGGNLYELAGDIADLGGGSGSIRQGWIETSAVDAISTLSDLISATKAAMASAKLMQYHDNLMGQTVNTFGRVS
jgi:flagellar basal-body rod protein FlgG